MATNEQTFQRYARDPSDAHRNAKATAFADGTGCLYSYGIHYVAAYVGANGTAYVNADRYSVTTARHLSGAASALRAAGYRVAYVPDLTTVARAMGWAPGWAPGWQRSAQSSAARYYVARMADAAEADAKAARARTDRMRACHQRTARMHRDAADLVAHLVTAPALAAAA